MFRKLLGYTRKARTAKYLKRRFWWATHSLEPLRGFACMIRRHKKGILYYFDLRIDNGIVEVMENDTKDLGHRAKGLSE